MFKNVAGQKLTVFAFDSTTNLPKTGDAANITAYYDLDDAGTTVLTDTSASERDSTNAKGYYIFDLAQGETNGNKIAFSAKSATSNIVVIAVPAVVYTFPASFTSFTTPPTAAAVATAVWQDTTSGDFTTSGSIGKSLFTSGAVPGASGGLAIAGTNAATTFATLTSTGAFTINGTSNVAQTGDAYAIVNNGTYGNSALNSTLTTIINRIGAFTGSGVNTILGFFKAGYKKDASTPSDVGGTFDPATDSQEAQTDVPNKVNQDGTVTWYVESSYFVAGLGAGDGSIIEVGEMVVQDSTGATGRVVNADSTGIWLDAVAGSPNSSDEWIGQTSAASVAPTATPAIVGSNSNTGRYNSRLLTIQKAVDLARPNDIVRVMNGNYSETILLKKPLSLIGQSQVLTKWTAANFSCLGLLKGCSHSRIRRFNFNPGHVSAKINVYIDESSGAPSNTDRLIDIELRELTCWGDDDGLHMYYCDHLKLIDVDSTGLFYGSIFQGCDNLLIERCRFTASQGSHAAQLYAMQIANSNNWRLKDSYLTASRTDAQSFDSTALLAAGSGKIENCFLSATQANAGGSANAIALDVGSAVSHSITVSETRFNSSKTGSGTAYDARIGASARVYDVGGNKYDDSKLSGSFSVQRSDTRLIRTTIATLASQTSFTLTTASTDNSAYIGATIIIQDGTTATQKAVGVISAYTGSTKTVTLLADPGIFTMAVGDHVTIMADRSLKATVPTRTATVASDGTVDAGDTGGGEGATVEEIVAALAQSARLTLVYPLTGGDMTLVEDDSYQSSASTGIQLVKQDGETGWPATVTTIHFSAAPDDQLIAENAEAEDTGVDDVALASVTNGGGMLSIDLTDSGVSFVRTPKSGRYDFWFVANKAGERKTVRTGKLKVVKGDAN